MDLKAMHTTLPIGQKKAMRIDNVAEMWGTSTREARRIIERMTYNDLIVCNLRSGYFVAETLQELEAEQKFINSYKCKILKKEYRIRKAVEREHERLTQCRLPI